MDVQRLIEVGGEREEISVLQAPPLVSLVNAIGSSPVVSRPTTVPSARLSVVHRREVTRISVAVVELIDLVTRSAGRLPILTELLAFSAETDSVNIASDAVIVVEIIGLVLAARVVLHISPRPLMTVLVNWGKGARRT